MSRFGIVPPTLSDREWGLMIHLFLDDSGEDGQRTNPWVCMAGYLVPHEPYVALLNKWLALLIHHGISEIHMRALIPIEGQYKKLGWDIPKRDEVLSEFVQAINETKMFGVGVAVEMEAWSDLKRDLSGHTPKLAVGPVQEFCVQRIMQRVVTQLHEAGVDDKLALVFDTDPEFGIGRFRLFSALMGHDQRAERRLSSITFGHPDQYPGLQAADLLAWETRKELMQKAGGYQSTKRWREMFTLMPDYHLEYTVGERWDAAAFAEARDEIIERGGCGLRAGMVAHHG